MLTTNFACSFPFVAPTRRRSQIAVRLDSAADSASRLATQPITSPASQASFEPIPSEALALLAAQAGPSARVESKFVSTDFDPYSTSPEAAAGGGGVARLVFQAAAPAAAAAAGAAAPRVLYVSGLSTPIRFSLPRGTRGGDTGSEGGRGGGGSARQQCFFWDEDLRVFASDGCAALPNPAPVGHTLGWADGAVLSQGALNASWTISGAPAARPVRPNCASHEAWAPLHERHTA